MDESRLPSSLTKARDRFLILLGLGKTGRMCIDKTQTPAARSGSRAARKQAQIPLGIGCGLSWQLPCPAPTTAAKTLASKGCMTRTETCETRNPRGDRDMKTFEFKDQWGDVTRVRLVRGAYADGSLAVQVPCARGVGGQADRKPLYVSCPSGRVKDGLRTGDRVRKPLSPVCRRPRSSRRGTATAGRGPARHRRYPLPKGTALGAPNTFVPRPLSRSFMYRFFGNG